MDFLIFEPTSFLAHWESGEEGVQEGREGEGRGEEVKGGKGRGGEGRRGEGRGEEGRGVRRCYKYDAFIDTPMSKRFVCNNYL